MIRWTVCVLTMTLALLPSGAATASNMGFALQLDISPVGQNLSFMSLPYTYAPTTAELLCQDLRNPGGPATVSSVWRWDEPTSTYVKHTCGSGTNNFTLEEGIAYGVVNTPGQTITGLVVGSHDDTFAYALAPTVGSNLTWISIPYHSAFPDIAGTSGPTDSEDLCRSIGPAVSAIVRWDAGISAYVSYACGSVFDVPFPIELGVGYALINAQGLSISWQPPHF